MGPQYTPLRVFKLNKRCHRKNHSVQRQHRSRQEGPQSYTISNLLPVHAWVTGVSQGSVHHALVSRCRKQGLCMPVPPRVWSSYIPP